MTPDVDMTGKVIAVTGANAGIGRATAEGLAGMGATILACGRNPTKLSEAAEAIRVSTGNDRVQTFVADLSSMAEVRSLAANIHESTDRLDVLINNAGVGVDRRVETVDGFELIFTVNYLAVFVLTTELLPLLKASAPSRVVTVSSALHTSVKTLDLEDLQSRKRFKWATAYNSAKLADILFSSELARRIEGSGVTSNALHPGVIATEFGGDGDLTGLTGLMFRVMKWFLPGPEAGARTSIHLASAPELERLSGRYFEKCREKAPSLLALDAELAQDLWAATEALVAGIDCSKK
ncbi:MAG: SDR family oxidoreductase [Planctomycetota bacterium]|jgi:NAD(P)-dependent dehydrogenase (short-subunit alcohol dehydrogenase family)